MSETKTYEHIVGLFGDEGENAGRLAVAAVLESNPNYPESGLIIVGSPPMTGYEPQLASFSGSPDVIEKLAHTLLQAVADVRAVRG